MPMSRAAILLGIPPCCRGRLVAGASWVPVFAVWAVSEVRVLVVMAFPLIVSLVALRVERLGMARPGSPIATGSALAC